MWCLARFNSAADAQAFWKIAASESGMLLFSGYGMVPGIKAVEPLSAGYKQIINTDGTRHRERTILCTDRSLVLEMDQFEGIGARLFASFSERWSLDAERATIYREFLVKPQNSLFARGVVKLLVTPQMLAAMRKNMQAIAGSAGVPLNTLSCGRR